MSAEIRTHRCRADDCGEQVPQHLLMCRRHWFRVPVPLRNRIYRTWRDRERDGWDRYTAAVREAVEVVKSHG